MKISIISTTFLSVILISFITSLMCTGAYASPLKGADRSSRIIDLQKKAKSNAVDAGDKVALILAGDKFGSLAKAIEATGTAIQHQLGDQYQVRVLVNQVESFLNKLPAGTFARLSYLHSSTEVISEGVDITGASDMHALSTDGAGVKIGIIDLGFTSLSTSQAANELPATGSGLTITDYTGTGNNGTNHGTNVAEIVHDMAPAAELYLAKVATDVELEVAVNDMIAQGVQVINHSVGWYGAAFYDGTGPICDVTATANAANIIWVNAAGNARREHYLGDFTDSNGNLSHEFATGQDYNTIDAVAGKTYSFVLNWDDYAASKPADYNMYVYDADPAAGGSIIASSTNSQFSNYPWPYEAITYTAPTSATHYIVVTKRNASTANKPLTLFSIGRDLGTQSNNSSLIQPADCNTVLTVGATKLEDIPEGFSSEGPTTDGRDKPEISAPDRVSTSLTSSFSGTSASSPHAAGGIALLIQQNPAMDITQIQALMTGSTYDVHTIGYDYRTGHGRFSLDADADGVNHDYDNCLLDYNPLQLDNDLDLSGDSCDEDDDNDGLTDLFEVSIGSDPLLSDTDGDNLSDFDEVAYDGDANTYTPGQDLNPVSVDTDNDLITDDSDPIPLNFNFNDGDLAPLGNPDGILNAADLAIAIKLSLGIIPVSNTELAHGDLFPSGAPDGIINVRDLLLIKQLTD